MPVVRSIKWYRRSIGGKRGPVKTIRLFKAFQNMHARLKGQVLDGNNRARWKGLTTDFEDFEDFRAWSLANGYRRGMALDRINEKEGYVRVRKSDGKCNVQWITKLENDAKARNIHQKRCKCVYCRAKKRNGYA